MAPAAPGMENPPRKSLKETVVDGAKEKVERTAAENREALRKAVEGIQSLQGARSERNTKLAEKAGIEDIHAQVEASSKALREAYAKFAKDEKYTGLATTLAHKLKLLDSEGLRSIEALKKADIEARMKEVNATEASAEERFSEWARAKAEKNPGGPDYTSPEYRAQFMERYRRVMRATKLGVEVARDRQEARFEGRGQQDKNVFDHALMWADRKGKERWAAYEKKHGKEGAAARLKAYRIAGAALAGTALFGGIGGLGAAGSITFRAVRSYVGMKVGAKAAVKAGKWYDQFFGSKAAEALKAAGASATTLDDATVEQYLKAYKKGSSSALATKRAIAGSAAAVLTGGATSAGMGMFERIPAVHSAFKTVDDVLFPNAEASPVMPSAMESAKAAVGASAAEPMRGIYPGQFEETIKGSMEKDTLVGGASEKTELRGSITEDESAAAEPVPPTEAIRVSPPIDASLEGAPPITVPPEMSEYSTEIREMTGQDWLEAHTVEVDKGRGFISVVDEIRESLEKSYGGRSWDQLTPAEQEHLRVMSPRIVQFMQADTGPEKIALASQYDFLDPKSGIVPEKSTFSLTKDGELMYGAGGGEQVVRPWQEPAPPVPEPKPLSIDAENVPTPSEKPLSLGGSGADIREGSAAIAAGVEESVSGIAGRVGEAIDAAPANFSAFLADFEKNASWLSNHTVTVEPGKGFINVAEQLHQSLKESYGQSWESLVAADPEGAKLVPEGIRMFLEADSPKEIMALVHDYRFDTDPVMKGTTFGITADGHLLVNEPGKAAEVRYPTSSPYYVPEPIAKPAGVAAAAYVPEPESKPSALRAQPGTPGVEAPRTPYYTVDNPRIAPDEASQNREMSRATREFNPTAFDDVPPQAPAPEPVPAPRPVEPVPERPPVGEPPRPNVAEPAPYIAPPNEPPPAASPAESPPAPRPAAPESLPRTEYNPRSMEPFTNPLGTPVAPAETHLYSTPRGNYLFGGDKALLDERARALVLQGNSSVFVDYSVYDPVRDVVFTEVTEYVRMPDGKIGLNTYNLNEYRVNPNTFTKRLA